MPDRQAVLDALADALPQVAAEFPPGPERDAALRRALACAADPDFVGGGGAADFAVRHAPHDMVIAGKPFKGGQFVPADDYARATPEQKAAVERSGPPPSKAPSSLLSPEAKYLAAAKKVFGRKPPTPARLADLVGAPAGCEVAVRAGGDRKSVVVKYQGGPVELAERSFHRLGSGEVYCENHYVRLKEQGTGLGSETFALQVAQCRAAGLGSVRCQAERGPKFNGYYTWALLGYDQDFEDLEDQGGDGPSTAEAARAAFPGAESVQDVLARPGGRAWWKEHGCTLARAKFDLSEGSRSMQVHEAYLEERARR